jgi:hypothetical protein
MDAMILNRTMPKNKAPKALKLSTKIKKPKTHPMFQSFQKFVESNFNLSFLQKQPCSNTILEIDNRSMRE